MTDSIDFETRLEARLRARAENAALPFDARVIARRALTPAQRGSSLALGWRALPRGLRWSLVAMAVAGSIAASLAIGAPLFEKSPQPPTLANGWVAYAVKGFEGGSDSDIWVARSGSVDQPLIGAPGDDVSQMCPTFSPNGTQLAYARRPRGRDESGGTVVVAQFRASTGQIVGEMTPAPLYGSGCPKWSPDGRRIAFEVDGHIWVVGLDGTTKEVFSSADNGESHPFDWSPDGIEIVVVVRNSLLVVPVNGGERRVIHEEANDVILDHPTWSPQGTHVLVEAIRRVPVGDVVRLEILPPRIVTVDGTAPVLELAHVEDGSPALSPDGLRLAYARPGGEIVIVGLDGADLRVLAVATGLIRGIVWAPDGTAVLYMVDGGPQGGPLFTVSTSGDAAPATLTGPHLFYNGQPEDLSWQPLFSPAVVVQPTLSATVCPTGIPAFPWPGARGDSGPGRYAWRFDRPGWMHREVELRFALEGWPFAEPPFLASAPPTIAVIAGTSAERRELVMPVTGDRIIHWSVPDLAGRTVHLTMTYDPASTADAIAEGLAVIESLRLEPSDEGCDWMLVFDTLGGWDSG